MIRILSVQRYVALVSNMREIHVFPPRASETRPEENEREVNVKTNDVKEK